MTKILGPQVGYIDILDTALLEKHAKDNQVRLYNPLRPSSAGKCARSLWYELQEYRGLAPVTVEDRDASVIRLLSLGSSVEYSVIQAFQAAVESFGMKIKYKQQALTIFRLVDGSLIEGSTDLCLESDQFKAVCDVKSKKEKFSKAFSSSHDEFLEKLAGMDSIEKVSDTCFYADSAVDLVDEFGDDFIIDNILQINLYGTSDFMRERGYDHCSLFYYNKNTSRMYELRFRPSEELKQRVLDKFNAVVSATRAEDLKPTYNFGSIRYAFCPYAKRIWGENSDAKKEFFTTFPKKTWPTEIYKVKSGREQIQTLFEQFTEAAEQADKKARIEQELTGLLYDQGIQKIRLENGHVYEVKLLKSPREHFELRRSKA